MQRKRQREDGATSPGLCQPQELGEGPDTGCSSEPPGGPSPWHLGLGSHLQQPWEAQASPEHSRPFQNPQPLGAPRARLLPRAWLPREPREKRLPEKAAT